VPYTFLLSTLGGTLVSEVPAATAKAFEVAVNGQGTSRLTIRGGTEDADFVLGGDALLKIYEVDPALPAGRVLLAHHRLVTAEEVGAENSVSVAATFADPLWILGRRLIGKSAAGYTRATADRGTIIAELVDAANAESPSGLRIGTVTASSATTVGGWFYKAISEAITELASTLDGPDYRVRPIDYTAGVIGELDVSPSIAEVRADAVFEYGEGLANVRSFKRAVSNEGLANRVISLPAGFPENAVGAVLQRDDAASADIRGLFESVVTADIGVDALRASILDAHLQVRRGPRQVITFELVADLGSRVPKLGRDFNVGDIVTFRATIRTDAGQLLKRINVLVRVYGYGVSVDEAGYGTPTLTVTPS